MNTVFSRCVSGFLVVQLINVQIQSAFGSEALALHNPEVRHALSVMESKISDRLSGLSESRQERLAYRFFKYSVLLRNRLQAKSDAAFERRTKALSDSEYAEEMGPIAPEEAQQETEITESLKTDIGVAEISKELQGTSIPTPRAVKRAKVIAEADVTLMALGARKNASGRLEMLPRAEFVEKMRQLEKSQNTSGRFPAALSFGKVLLILVVLTLGLAVTVFAIGWFGLAVVYGSSNVFFGIFLILVAIGGIVGTIFGIRAIVRSAIEKRDSTPPQSVFA